MNAKPLSTSDATLVRRRKEQSSDIPGKPQTGGNRLDSLLSVCWIQVGQAVLRLLHVADKCEEG